MKSDSHARRGFTLVELLVVLIVLGGLVYAACFVVNKFFRVTVTPEIVGPVTITGKESNPDPWSDADVVKDHVRYLTWALDTVGKADQDLRASWLSLKTRKIANQRTLDEHTAEQTREQGLLDDLIVAYRTATASNRWPATVRDRSFEEVTLKSTIVECHHTIKNESIAKEAATIAAKKIDEKLSVVEGELRGALTFRNELRTDLEIAKVKKVVDGIDSIRDRLKAIRDRASVLNEEPDGSRTVKEMAKPSAEKQLNDEFSKIMGGSAGVVNDTPDGGPTVKGTSELSREKQPNDESSKIMGNPLGGSHKLDP